MIYQKKQAEKILLKACKELVRSGLIARTWGNVSIRLSKDLFLITPSGRAYETLEAKELHEAVDKAVQHLKPSERRLFEMRQIEGLELDDIAKRTNIAKPSIKSIVSAARKKVFEEIKERLRK